MITGLDHVVVLLEDIQAGSAAFETLLARKPSWQNSGEGADRVLFTLDNMSLELMAPAGQSPAADRIRNVIKIWGEGLASICFATDDIGKMHRRLERVALKPEPIAEVDNTDRISGQTLHWKRTRAMTDLTRGVRMFFLELAGPRPMSEKTADSAVLGLDHIVVSTEDPERAAALYGARLGLDMALDRSHQEWGQLMFFRCGDLVVEVTHRPGKQSNKVEADAPDRLRGICWRVADIDATHARLVAAGVDVSEIRAGRKPGTRVMTVRNGTCGVPTLLVQPSQGKPD